MGREEDTRSTVSLTMDGTKATMLTRQEYLSIKYIQRLEAIEDAATGAILLVVKEQGASDAIVGRLERAGDGTVRLGTTPTGFDWRAVKDLQMTRKAAEPTVDLGSQNLRVVERNYNARIDEKDKGGLVVSDPLNFNRIMPIEYQYAEAQRSGLSGNYPFLIGRTPVVPTSDRLEVVSFQRTGESIIAEVKHIYSENQEGGSKDFYFISHLAKWRRDVTVWKFASRTIFARATRSSRPAPATSRASSR